MNRAPSRQLPGVFVEWLYRNPMTVAAIIANASAVHRNIREAEGGGNVKDGARVSWLRGQDSRGPGTQLE